VPLGNLLLASTLSLASLVLLRRILLRSRGSSTMEDLMALKAAGAQVVDVRTPAEYAQGHAAGSVNIPLDELRLRIPEIDPGTPVIVCCASGGRSGQAKAMLEQAGYPEVHNAGPWTRLA
jgi:rhodanese-related sulfurtransferase